MTHSLLLLFLLQGDGAGAGPKFESELSGLLPIRLQLRRRQMKSLRALLAALHLLRVCGYLANLALA